MLEYGLPGVLMKKLLLVFPAVPAAILIFMGVRWLANPYAAAQAQFMPLLEGMALSSQIADIGAVFFCMGCMILLGLITQNKTWIHATIFILITIAIMRIIAWLFHDAALAIPMIVVELVMSGMLYFAANKLSRNPTQNLNPKES